MTYEEAFASWKSEIKPEVVATYGEDDETALSESWNDYTDSLCKDGQLNDLQYHYCPAWDDEIPDDDKEFILNAMGASFACIKIAERPDKFMSDMPPGSSHWRVLIKRAKREFTIHYSMGPAHTGTPADMDIFYSLLMDTSAIDGANFEDWAADYGYDADSRKAEAAFKACQDTLLNLRSLFKESELDDLRELFEDY